MEPRKKRMKGKAEGKDAEEKHGRRKKESRQEKN
jgi:hypothetical protein